MCDEYLSYGVVALEGCCHFLHCPIWKKTTNICTALIKIRLFILYFFFTFDSISWFIDYRIFRYGCTNFGDMNYLKMLKDDKIISRNTKVIPWTNPTAEFNGLIPCKIFLHGGPLIWSLFKMRGLLQRLCHPHKMVICRTGKYTNPHICNISKYICV